MITAGASSRPALDPMIVEMPLSGSGAMNLRRVVFPDQPGCLSVPVPGELLILTPIPCGSAESFAIRPCSFIEDHD